MSFRPNFTHDRVWASIAMLALFALALFSALAILKRPLGPGVVILGALTLIFLGLGLLLIYRLWSLHTLDYWVQRDAIHIHWHGEEVIVPLPEIQDIRSAQDIALRPNWLHWPLQWVRADAEQRILAYATQSPANSISIITSEETYFITPQNPDIFIAAWKERQDFGPARHLKPVIYLSSWRQHWLLRDRLAQGLIFGGLLLGFVLLAYVAWHYPQLPATIALHFDARGEPDLLSPRRSIFLIPGVSLLIGFLNAAIGFAFYDAQRFLSYLLWSASLILQIAGLFIAANLITLAVQG